VLCESTSESSTLLPFRYQRYAFKRMSLNFNLKVKAIPVTGLGRL
jgi:hypothetical protein